MSQDEPTEPEHPPSSAPPRPGERVGRFIVLDPLGSGGMGLVWSAFDPKLDRKVALKFLKAGGGEEREARLLREAQALARLSHPNVVAVHDVDTHGGRVFVAMELVVGRTLQDWLRQQRSWREVLRALLEAGRGVAAAHGAGIIHRDIKPANVLVGEDGRVRVSDFGLARALEESPTAPADAPVAEPALNEPMTGAGHVVGTREYMSPEQAAGAPLDARTDVYSFCVTAYEALCGIRPEALSMGFTVGLAPEPRPEPEPVRPTWRKSSDRQMLARLPAPAAGRKPPRRLLRHLAHGLQTDPDRRWPSMPPLLDALERDARPWRPWHLAAVAAVALAAASATVVRLGRDSCSVGAAQIAPVWSAADRDWLERSFSAAARGDPEAAPRAARLLDAYASRWQAAYLDACEAMRAGAQAPQLGALRLSCLEARRQEAAAVVDLFRHATAATVQQSSDAVLGLPGVSGCGEVDALSTPVPPPDDGPVRQQIDRLSRDLARVVAESAAGDPRALGHAEALVAEANQVGFAPLQAEALLSLGSAYLYGGRPDLARDLYLRSLTSAERGRVDAVRARACARLAWSVGHYFGHYEEADRWMEAALAILDRTPAIDAEVNARHILASLRTAEGRIQESLAALDRMDELIRKRGRPDDPDRVRALSARSDDLAELGRFQEAAGYAREALARQIELRGTRHPITARLEYLLARVLVEAGGTVEARELLDRTASYWIDAGTPSAPELLDAGDIRATSFQREGRFQQALDEALRIRAIRERAQGPDHADLSFTLGNVGFALLGLGRPAEAITPLERALALQTRAGLKLSPTAEGKLALAQALWRTGGDRARARALARDAEQASRIAPEGRIHREAAAWLAEHPDPAPRVDGQ